MVRFDIRGRTCGVPSVRPSDPSLALMESLEPRLLLSGQVFTSTDTLKAIPDMGTVHSVLEVTGTCYPIADVNVWLNITHTIGSDLEVYLRGPDGTSVELFTDVGVTGDFPDTTLDDQASRSIADVVDGISPITGVYRPEGSLADFNGRGADGAWRIEVTDTGVFSSGTVNAWSLEIDTPDTVAPTMTWLSPLADTPITTPQVNLDVEFSEPVQGVDAADVELVWLEGAGGAVSEPVFLGENRWRWTLTDLSDGLLILQIAGEAGDIEDLSGNDLAPTSRAYPVDVTAPTVVITPVDPNPRTTSVDEITLTFSEAVELELHDLALSRDFTDDLGVPDSLDTADNITWTLGSLAPLTGEFGNYTLTVADTVSDMVGNTLTAPAVESWSMGPAAAVIDAEPEWTTGTSNTITWSAVPAAEVYQVQCDDDPVFASPHGDSGWISDTSHTFDGLAPGVTYYYRARSGVAVEDDSGLWSQTSRADFLQDERLSTDVTGSGDVVLARELISEDDYTGGYMGWSYGFDRYVMNIFEATQDGVLANSGVLLNTSESASLMFVVYEGGTGLNDPYTRVSSSVLNDSGVGDWYRWGSVNAQIHAGRYYLIGVAWDGYVAGTYNNNRADTSFGRHAGTYSGTGYPPSASLVYSGAGGGTAAYAMGFTFQYDGDYEPQGHITSPSIHPSQLARWGELSYATTMTPGGTLGVDILDAAGNVLASDVPTGIDLDSLGITAASVKLRAALATTVATLSPALHDWSIGWVESTGLYAAGPWSAVEPSSQWGSIAPTGVDLAADSDTGVSDTDNLMNLDNSAPDRALVFDVSGTVDEAVVSLYADGVLIATATGVEGTTRVTTNGAVALAEGPHAITARQAIADRPQSGDSAALPILLDLTAPDAPELPDLTFLDDTGVSSEDNITANNSPEFTVTSTDACYAVYLDGVLASGEAESAPTYVLAGLTDGAHTVAVAAVDAAGNESPLGPALAVEIDTDAPTTPPAPDLQALSDTGVSDADDITKLTTLTFDVISTDAYYLFYSDTSGLSLGRAEAGSPFTVEDEPQGARRYFLIAMDVAGNTSPFSPDLAVTIDTTPPVVNVPVTMTTDSTPSLQGGIDDPAATVEITVDGAVYDAMNLGFWLLPDNTIDPPLVDGAYDVQVVATDAAGNVGADATSDELIIFTYGEITGRLWHDLNADGDGVAEEPSLESWTVFVDLDDDGVYDGGEPAALTDATGTYRVDTVVPGEYTVRAIVQPGWLQSTDDGDVTVPNGAAGKATPIGLYRLGGIRGTLRYDGDGDGDVDPTEPPLEHRSIYLDLDGDGAPGAADPQTTTDEDGAYVFEGLTPGIYTVRMDDLAYGHVSFPDTGAQDIIVPSGEVVENVDFAYHWPVTEIHGAVWRDLDENNVRDPGDPGLPDRKVFLDKDGSGTWNPLEPMVLTSDDGTYVFERVVPGAYTIRLLPRSYESVVFPEQKIHTVELAAGDTVAEQDFGCRWPVTEIHGAVYVDLDGNHNLDAGEGLEGWTVFIDVDTDGAVDPEDTTATTDSEGDYVFDDFAPGPNTLVVLPPDDWRAFEPASGRWIVDVAPGQILSDMNFMVVQFGDVTGRVWLDLNHDKQRQDPEEPLLSDWIVYVDSNRNGTLDGGSSSFPGPSMSHEGEGTVDVALSVPRFGFRIVDVAVDIDLNLTEASEAELVLISPAGTSVRLLSLPDRGQNYTEPLDLVLDDAALLGLLDDPLGHDSEYRPAEPLAALFGETTEGTWRLQITTEGEEASWRLDSWSLHISVGEIQARTESDGSYVLNDLFGEIRVCVDLPIGWVSSNGPLQWVTVPKGQTVDGIDFGVWPEPAVIGGQVFLDVEPADGVHQPHEFGLNGWTIELVDAATGEVLDTRTAAWDDWNHDSSIDPVYEMGLYEFGDLLPGEYLVRHPDAAGAPHTTAPERMYALVGSNQIGRIDMGTGQLLEQWPVPSDHVFMGLAMGPQVLYALSTHQDPYAAAANTLVAKIWRLDPDTMDVLDVDVACRIDGATERFVGLAYLDGRLFTVKQPVSGQEPGTQMIVWDTAAGQIVEAFDVPTLFGPVTGAADRGVLYGMLARNVVAVLDPTTGELLDEIALPPLGQLVGVFGYASDELLVRPFSQPTTVYRVDLDSARIVGWLDPDSSVRMFTAADGISGVHRLTLAPAEQRNDVDFGTYDPTEIRGQAFADADEDGRRDPGEYGLNGVAVMLRDAGGGITFAAALTHSEDTNGDGRIDPVTEAGIYSFDNLPPELYRVTEAGLANWTRTWPEGTDHLSVTTIPGHPMVVDFGYHSENESVAPVGVDLLPAFDTGVSAADDATRLHNGDAEHVLRFAVTGTAPGAEVEIYAGDILIGSTTAMGATTEVTTNGTSLLEDNAHEIKAYQVEPNKNKSGASDPLWVFIDSTPPRDSGLFLASSTADWGSQPAPWTVWENGRPVPSVPWIGMDRLVFSFDEIVRVAEGVFTVTGQITGEIAVVGVTGVGTDQLTIVLDTPLSADTYDLNWSLHIEDEAGAFEEPDGWQGAGLLHVLPGDVTGDGAVGADDYDAVRGAVAAGETSPLYDLDTDGVVDGADADFLLTAIIQPTPGDATLDGSVDLNDFVVLKQNFGTGVGWVEADFTGDGVVNLNDFVVLKHNFGAAAGAPAPSVAPPANLTASAAEEGSADQGAVVPVRVAWRRRPRWRRRSVDRAVTDPVDLLELLAAPAALKAVP